MSLIALFVAAAPFTAEETRRLDCVAAVATIAHEQKRGRAAASSFPPLVRDGERFAQVVGAALVAGGRTKEEVRDAMLAAAATRQKRTASGMTQQAEIDGCVELMRAVAPPPTLVQCAALVAIEASGQPASTEDLRALAAALDSRARSALRAQGLDAAAVDAEMAAARVGVAVAAVERRGDNLAGDPDLTPCLEYTEP